MRKLALLLGSLAAASAASSAAASPPAPPAAEAKDPSAQRISGSDNYVPTFGLRASISRGYKVFGVMAVDAGLDVPKEDARKTCAARQPMLISAMREAVLNYASLSYIIGERPDADLLRARLQKAADQVLGKGASTVVLASVIVFNQ